MDSGLATLLTLADSRLPTGGHVHSGGVEEAVTSGLVADVVTLRAYLRRRIRTHGLVTASIAAAVHGGLDPVVADRETDARTPAPAARLASRAQGRGLLRLARRVWPDAGASGATGEGSGASEATGECSVWQLLGSRPHLAVASGVVGRVSGLAAEQTCATVVYTTMTGSATAAQRLLALDPADVAALTFELSGLCDSTAAEAAKGLADLSDPLLDVLAQRHAGRDRPLFAS
ncbi:urease accessory protein UreF [Mycolicibacterium aubagnense]|uniref:Urease accessory protein UreF n=1 Tax=Mycolicibacterium aubagnense TaxID=319707 RepID=A0ABN5YMW7_9MYCO|nr:urease accessory UreF family protein [Mycolicibacterium aubagnense]TLH61813.1 urease accessory protein UreF [Mycolicibacterium aubagnense]WGI35207.1 urease accessory UreF family protein [Mycolicibacterium aubagnense]BBX82841.1 urease accessory protein UreF [Mycolicibacterium aubagnense]